MAELQDPTADIVKQAQRAMMAERFDEARGLLDRVLGPDPSNPDALYAAAVCARYRVAYAEADQYLVRLKTEQPEFGRAYQEEGYLRQAQNRPEEALTAFRLACRFNPALTSSWQAQAALLQSRGEHAEAAQAEAQAQRLKSLPKEVTAVSHLLAEGKILKAEALCRNFLKAHPRHVEAMRLLAEIGVQLGILDDAEFLLESALEFEPGNIQVRLDYIQVLRKRQKFEQALQQARQLYESDPGNPVFRSHFAIENMQTGNYETALTLFDEILQSVPGDPLVLTSRGHALKTMGRQEDAVTSYRDAVKRAPAHGDAWYGLANLKTYRFGSDEIAAMEREEAATGLPHADRVHLCFALGKAHEDAGDYDASFSFYERGNRLKKAQARYTAEQMAQEFEAQKTHCTAELMQRRFEGGHAAADPIFIVGLPRAGSTLLEQILASHSQVDGTLELPNILSLAHRLRGRDKLSDRERYPRVLGALSAPQRADLGAEYVETTRIHRAGAAFFTDKMPNNFRHIGLIKLILPNAKIIDARREPMACCFSGFKQLFAEGQEFTYGLHEVGAYYRGYVDLMRHWDRVLPGEILRVQYEDVVEDLEQQVRRILDFCGLPFEQACLDFHKTDRAVRTASSEQVRQPINRSGLEQWRHFDSHLEPLREALGPALTGYRD
ncbi:tetratricopeptide repeat-containing sulfotransferase family protein [Maricaulis sp.]|uniref:tetratricopeptide repeat-containing sulfotransferase family protein n=1 Tax=Maricaulis sp. TaxID=1486257 RepID=UPI0026201D21|nr:tetratricopeptide repeat-containing sulfotransferase family protein [Maricaulis sp.]